MNVNKISFTSNSDTFSDYFSIDSNSQAEMGNFLNYKGNIIEKYFNTKLKLFLTGNITNNEEKKGNDNNRFFFKTIYIKKYLEKKLNNTIAEKNNKLKKEIEEIFKNITEDIEIDCLIKNVNGDKVNKFFKTIQKYCISNNKIEDKIENSQNYTVITEITVNLASKISKKNSQIFTSFYFFNKFKKFINKNIENFNDFFINFKDLNFFKNNNKLIFLLITNHNYKGFKIFKEIFETEEETKIEKIKKIYEMKNKLKKNKKKKDDDKNNSINKNNYDNNNNNNDKYNYNNNDNNNNNINNNNKYKDNNNNKDNNINNNNNNINNNNNNKDNNNNNNNNNNNDNNNNKDNNNNIIKRRYINFNKLTNHLIKTMKVINEDEDCFFCIIYFDNYLNLIFPREEIEEIIRNNQNNYILLEEKLKNETKKREEVEKTLEDLKKKHEEAINELQLKKEEAINELQLKQEEAINELQLKQEEAINELQLKQEDAINELRLKHEEAEKNQNEKIIELKNMIDSLMNKNDEKSSKEKKDKI